MILYLMLDRVSVKLMLQKMNPDDFDKVFDIMEQSFPCDEYRSYDEQKQLLNNSEYSVYVVTQVDKIKAFISVYLLDDFAFIEHFAVNPVFRNQGIGSDILKELKNMLNCQLCLEVELPETQQAVRRIEFYKRNGFYLNNYPYEQPPFSADKNPVPLLIMTTGMPLSKYEFLQIKKTLYNEVYHITDIYKN